MKKSKTELLTQFFRLNKSKGGYFLAGVWNTVLSIFVNYFFQRSFPDFNPLVVFLTSTFLILLQSHYILREFIWCSSKPYLIELTKFISGYVPGIFVNLLAIQIFVNWLGSPFIQVLVISSIIISIILYFYHDNVTFGQKEKEF